MGVDSEIGECSSSILYKENISDFEGGLSIVSKMRPVTFDWKETGKNDIGLISEEVLEIEPRLVTVDKETGEVGGVNYRHYTAVLTKAVQELKAENDALKQLVCLDHPGADICQQEK